MVEPIDFQNMVDLKRSVDDKKGAKLKPGSGQSAFASELNRQNDLSESQVQNTHAGDMYIIHDDEHGEQKQKPQQDSAEPPDEDVVDKEQHIIDTTAGIESTQEEEGHNVDIKI